MTKYNNKKTVKSKTIVLVSNTKPIATTQEIEYNIGDVHVHEYEKDDDLIHPIYINKDQIILKPNKKYTLIISHPLSYSKCSPIATRSPRTTDSFCFETTRKVKNRTLGDIVNLSVEKCKELYNEGKYVSSKIKIQNWVDYEPAEQFIHYFMVKGNEIHVSISH